MKKQYKPVICKDGFKMSVQASEYTYCTPRIDNAKEYTEVEVGFPNKPEPLLMSYADNPASPTDTVYGWVPSQVIVDVVAKHGGIVEGELPPGIPYLEAS